MIRLAVRVRRADAELALAELLALAPSGVEEVDLEPDVIEYAVYGAPGELPALPDLRAAAGEALVEVRTSEVADDWDTRWRAFHRPVLIGDPARGPALYVRPPWAPAHATDRIHDVVIDPGQAFGTGAHPTTRMCLELMLELAGEGRARGPLCDVGCGSGVLAIAAARLGWSPVLACDHERESVSATSDNAVLNGVAVEARRRDLRREAPPPAPTVVANLLRPLLVDLARALTPSPRVLVAGGLLEQEADGMAMVMREALGLRERSRRQADGWAALLLGH